LTATRDIEIGTQLKIDYSEDESKCWLPNYGFVSGYKSIIPVTFRLSETDPMYAEKVQMLKE
jgi:hypothetical protein